jgi:hypothetical protein
MNIPGKKVNRVRLVRTERFVIAVDVEAVIPDADTSEVCYPPEVVELLREVELHAQAGDTRWLARRGKVFEAITAA